jgi:hypothetical protein
VGVLLPLVFSVGRAVRPRRSGILPRCASVEDLKNGPLTHCRPPAYVPHIECVGPLYDLSSQLPYPELIEQRVAMNIGDHCSPSTSKIDAPRSMQHRRNVVAHAKAQAKPTPSQTLTNGERPARTIDLGVAYARFGPPNHLTVITYPGHRALIPTSQVPTARSRDDNGEVDTQNQTRSWR